MSVEELILKYFYDFFPDIRIFPGGSFPIKEIGLDPIKDAIEFGKVFDQLKQIGYINQKGIEASITIMGIAYYEYKYLKPNFYFLKVIKIILEIFEKLENGNYPNYSIPNSVIIDVLQKEGITMDNKKFYQFLVTLDVRANFFKNIGPFGIQTQDEIRVQQKNEPVLTPGGRKFLESFKDEKELFLWIKDPIQKQILLEEYNALQEDIQHEIWKNACIKIGEILEYLLTLWLKTKNITPSEIMNTKKAKKWKDVSFEKMIQFYMKNSRKYIDEIGSYTDWNLVKNILKDYRNYIHLLKYEERVKQGDFLRKKEFERIFPIFQEIVNKFNL